MNKSYSKTDREKRVCLMRREGMRLAPVSQFDADMLAELSSGADVEVSFKQRRSAPQLRAYWVWLAEVVKATECAPNAEHLHETLKLATGYVTRVRRLDGTTIEIPDSVAFSRMEGAEFTGYFRRAERLVAEHFGFTKEQMERAA